MKIKNFKLKIAIFALFIFFCANIASAASISKPPNNLGLVGYWPLDEGTGTLAHDFSGKGNNGNISNVSWVSGKRGNALSFDGTSGSVVVFPGINLTSTFSMTAWINYRSCVGGSSDCTIIGSTDTFSAGWYMHNSGIQFWYNIGSSNTAVTPNKWHHIAMVGNGSNVTFYLDGQPDGVIGVGNAGTWNTIGNDSPAGDSDYTNGNLDDVRIYNRAISAAEIASLYKNGGTKLSSTNSAKGTLANDLVGWWTMDGKDTPWSSATAGTVIDKSGNGRNGTLTNMKQASSAVPGKIGQAMNFNGTSQYIDFGNISAFDMGTNDWTYSAWIKANSTSVNIILTGKLSYVGGGNPDAWQSGISLTGRLQGKLFKSGGTTFTPIDDGAVLTDNKWHHITVVWNRSGNLLRYVDGVISGTALDISSLAGQNISNTQSFQIGARDQVGDELYFPGSIDDVRVYNRALSATEIQQLYGASVQKIAMSDVGKRTLSSGQVGYWTFNNKDLSWTSNIAFDRSGLGNNGTMINMSTTSSPVVGKVGQALKFNGVNSNVTVLGNSTVNDMAQKSVCAWIKPNTGGHIISKSDNVPGVGSGWNFHVSSNSLNFYQGHCGGADMYGYGPTITRNTWSHVCFSYDNSSNSNPVYFYLNGAQSSSGGTGASAVCADTTYDIHIGSADTANDDVFNGLIDDVRVFNRIISPSEAKQLYNSGR